MSFFTVIVQERGRPPTLSTKRFRGSEHFPLLGDRKQHHWVIERTPNGTARNVTCTYVTRDMTLNVSWCTTSTTFDFSPPIHSLNWSFIFSQYITHSDNWSLLILPWSHMHPLTVTHSELTNSLTWSHSQSHSLSHCHWTLLHYSLTVTWHSLTLTRHPLTLSGHPLTVTGHRLTTLSLSQGTPSLSLVTLSLSSSLTHHHFTHHHHRHRPHPHPRHRHHHHHHHHQTALFRATHSQKDDIWSIYMYSLT